MRLRINRPLPAMVVAGTALAISLGGTGYAAVKAAREQRRQQAIEEEAQSPTGSSPAAP